MLLILKYIAHQKKVLFNISFKYLYVQMRLGWVKELKKEWYLMVLFGSISLEKISPWQLKILFYLLFLYLCLVGLLACYYYYSYYDGGARAWY